MTVPPQAQAPCRTLDEIRAAGRNAARRLPPLTQRQADLVAAILAPYQPRTVRPGAASAGSAAA